MKHLIKTLVLALVTIIFASCNENYRFIVVTRPDIPIIIRTAPPGPLSLWIEGEWMWDGNSYIWRNGYWTMPHRGYHWIAGSWKKANGGWYWHNGHWKR